MGERSLVPCQVGQSTETLDVDFKQPTLLKSQDKVEPGDVLCDRSSGGLFEEIGEASRIECQGRTRSKAEVDPDLEILREAQ